MIPCSWKENFSVECPGCGAQRSFFELIEGHFLESIKLFPALIPLFVVFVLTLLIILKPRLFSPNWIVGFFTFSAILMFGNFLFKLLA